MTTFELSAYEDNELKLWHGSTSLTILCKDYDAIDENGGEKTDRFVTRFYSTAVARIAKKSEEWAAEVILKSVASIIIKSLIYL